MLFCDIRDLPGVNASHRPRVTDSENRARVLLGRAVRLGPFAPCSAPRECCARAKTIRSDECGIFFEFRVLSSHCPPMHLHMHTAGARSSCRLPAPSSDSPSSIAIFSAARPPSTFLALPSSRTQLALLAIHSTVFSFSFVVPLAPLFLLRLLMGTAAPFHPTSLVVLAFSLVPGIQLGPPDVRRAASACAVPP